MSDFQTQAFALQIEAQILLSPPPRKLLWIMKARAGSATLPPTLRASPAVSSGVSTLLFRELGLRGLYPKGPKIEKNQSRLKFSISLTLPTLQINFVNNYFVFAWGFCIEKCRGFSVNFFWSPFPMKRSTKTPQIKSGKIRSKILGKIQDENLKNSGNFRFATFLT